MGGDHKCPVCQATFTRPQHVARHMRSHTGDRPYKCVHCGDQFARSDLLSRHVNKCHAGSGKGASAAGAAGGVGGRRKGTTAAARATTSKQACDQCVQSSLPCDGANPCAKCVTRKTRCTFVKFHRQTAPVGPGHASSLSASHPSSLAGSGSGSSSAAGSAYSLDGGASASGRPFLYAQSAAGGGGGGGAFAFDAGGPSPTMASRDAMPQFAFNPYSDYRERDGYGNGSGGEAYDYSDGYASSDYSSTGSRPPSSAGLSDYGGYHSQLDAHGHPHPHGLDLHQPDFSGTSATAFGLLSLDGHSHPPEPMPVFSANPVAHIGLGMAPPEVVPLHAHAHGHGSHHSDHRLSLPPLPPVPAYQSAAGSAASPISSAMPGSSALSTATNSQAQAQTQTPGETREMREFWKAYMRTPLTGPGLDPLGLKTPNASASNANAAAAHGGILSTPTAGGRLFRVASMPSVKTPRMEEDDFDLRVQGFGSVMAQLPGPGPAQATAQAQANANPPKPPAESEDLRSYEAAVLARKAPEMVLRKPAKMRRPVTSHGPGASGSGGGFAPPGASGFDFNAIARERANAGSRPGTASNDGASSLAGAFGVGGGGGLQADFGSGSTGSSPSASSSAEADDEGEGDVDIDFGLGVGAGAGRPSFKRLPSQALEPAGSKRRREVEVR